MHRSGGFQDPTADPSMYVTSAMGGRIVDAERGMQVVLHPASC
jgi:hypothetical protein